jgi:hypothetical protein
MIQVLIASLKAVEHERPAGYLDAVLSAGTVVGEYVYLEDETYAALAKRYSGSIPPKGPGTILHRVFNSIGIMAVENCPCMKRMAQMDQWGWSECLNRVDEIVGWLGEEAGRRGLPFSTTIVRAALVTGLAAGAKVYGDETQ